jgi:hypothetical protein
VVASTGLKTPAVGFTYVFPLPVLVCSYLLPCFFLVFPFLHFYDIVCSLVSVSRTGVVEG